MVRRRLTAHNTSRRDALALATESARGHGSQLLYVLVDLARNITFCEDHPGQPDSGGMTLAWESERSASAYRKRWNLGDNWRPQPYPSHSLDEVAAKMRSQGHQVSWRMAHHDIPPSILADHVDPATGQVLRVKWGDAWAWYVEDDLALALVEHLEQPVRDWLLNDKS